MAPSNEPRPMGAAEGVGLSFRSRIDSHHNKSRPPISQAANNPAIARLAQRKIVARLRRQRLVEHLHLLGPALLDHFIREIEVTTGADVTPRLEQYSEIDPEFVRAIGGGRQFILHRYAKLLAGEIHGDSVICPGPWRPHDDRSLLVTPSWPTTSGETVEDVQARDRASALASGKIKIR